MARRPRTQNEPIPALEITDTEVIRYEKINKRLIMRIQVDGTDYRRVARRVETEDPAVHQQILDQTAINLQESLNTQKGRQGADDVRDGVRNWSSLPEGDDKQRIAQQAVRDVVMFAREGKILQAAGSTKPDAYLNYANTRSIKANIWDQLDHIGNNVDKAAYLALSGPGDGTEFGELNKYMNDLGNAAADWNAVSNFMRDCNNPIEVLTPMTV